MDMVKTAHAAHAGSNTMAKTTEFRLTNQPFGPKVDLIPISGSVHFVRFTKCFAIFQFTDESGFQIWGDTPSEPSDYFWGRTARDFARDGVRWFARGGSHLNYYMLSGACLFFSIARLQTFLLVS